MSGKYIVVFKNTATPDEINQYASEVNTNGGTVRDVWTGGMKGFSAEIPHQYMATLQSLVDDGPIDYIEEDGVVTTQ
ncbi:protease propeptide/inhibitor [Cytidiella melzeri]|nr:protease propeptide/inhibitor [Cytidiella melzeri]